MTIRAALTSDRKSVMIRGRLWRDTFPVEKLAAWLKFYRDMAARKGGKYAGHYQPTVEALERVEKQLKDAA